MKSRLFFSLIGAIIIFVWQFFSFAMPNFHRSANAYTPLQDSILNSFTKSGLKEGMYLLGQPDPSLSQEAQAESMKSLEGKPWAVLNYHASNTSDMAMPMIRGFLVCFVISFMLFWIFQQQKFPTLSNRLLIALAIGMIGFFYSPYTKFIWYKDPDIFAYFADGIIPWLLLGFIGHKMAPAEGK